MTDEFQDCPSQLDHFSLTDFQPYQIRPDDIFGRCRPTNEYTSCDSLGSGSSGIVSKGRHTKTGEIVALKYIDFNSDTEFPQEIFREINNLNQLDHKNIVKLLEVAVSDRVNSLCLVLEYCPFNLEEYIKDYPKNDIPLKIIKCVARQIFSGLKYMHHNFIVHRDLKPSNLLISEDRRVKIADLGSSRRFYYELGGMTPGVGTAWYRAPEVLLESDCYGPAVDMWASGCIIGELFTRNPILPGASDINQINLIIDLLGAPNYAVWKGFPRCKALKNLTLRHAPFTKNFGEQFPKIASTKHSLEIFSSLIKYDPTARLTAAQCLSHEWFDTAPVGAKRIEVDFMESQDNDKE